MKTKDDYLYELTKKAEELEGESRTQYREAVKKYAEILKSPPKISFDMMKYRITHPKCNNCNPSTGYRCYDCTLIYASIERLLQRLPNLVYCLNRVAIVCKPENRCSCGKSIFDPHSWAIDRLHELGEEFNPEA